MKLHNENKFHFIYKILMLFLLAAMIISFVEVEITILKPVCDHSISYKYISQKIDNIDNCSSSNILNHSHFYWNSSIPKYKSEGDCCNHTANEYQCNEKYSNLMLGLSEYVIYNIPTMEIIFKSTEPLQIPPEYIS